MIPKNIEVDFEFGELPTKTYKLNLSKEKISGYTDELQAMVQAIYLMLNIERFEHVIYSWNYGVELADLIGKSIPFILPEIERRISEALLQDSRIENVFNFVFDTKSKKKVVNVSFDVKTIFGDIATEIEVKV